MLRVVHEGGARFRADCRGHSLTLDQPEEDAGSDAGMTPPELFAASLAGCVGYYVARYCQQADIDTAGLAADCDWSVAEHPHRIGALRVGITLPGLPDNRRKAVERAASLCLIHATLQHEPQVH
ncbi:MAG TPA: OsmC family protein, partial [Mariprofundaceae bacterium]|nr:OsmC family protein [Mariprofundaceae bacterium]